MRTKRADKMLAALMALCLALPVVGTAPAGAQACAHEHGGTCGYAESPEGASCAHEHDGICGYAEPADGAPCAHVHDDSCGGLSPEESGVQSGPATPARIAVASFDPLPEDVASQSYGAGELESAAGATLPATLGATDDQGGYLAIEGVAWECEAFDPAAPGEYAFAAKLPEGYALKGGAEAPVIAVEIFEAMSRSGKNPPFRSVTVEGINYMLLSTAGTASVDNNQGYAGSSVTIPDKITVTGVEGWDGEWTVDQIGSSAFSGCANLTSVSLSEGVRSIAYRAFEYTGLTAINIPASVEEIGTYAFYGCSSLATVNFAANSKLRIINDSTFRQTGLTGIDIPVGVETIELSAFEGCGRLTTVNFAAYSSLRTIHGSAFLNAGLTSISIPASVEIIGLNAFEGCDRLATVNFAANSKLRTIGGSTFKDTGLTSISIPASVEAIEWGAFMGCGSLAYINIAAEGKLASIGSHAFYGSGISGAMTLPATVSFIGASAFANNLGLQMVVFTKSDGAPTIESGAFSGSANGVQPFAVYPAAAEAAYKAQPGLPPNNSPDGDSVARIGSVLQWGRHAVVDEATKTVYLHPQNVSDPADVVPHVIYFYGKSIDPNPSTVTDYSSPVTYTVTAKDGTQVRYTVKTAGEYSVSGTLVLDGKIQRNTSVYLMRNGKEFAKANTGSTDGVFTFTQVPPGSFTLEVPAESTAGEWSASLPVTVAGDITGIELQAKRFETNVVTFERATTNGSPYKEGTTEMRLFIGKDFPVLVIVGEATATEGLFDDFVTFIQQPGMENLSFYFYDFDADENSLIFRFSEPVTVEQMASVKLNPLAWFTVRSPATCAIALHGGNYTHGAQFADFDGAFPEAAEGYGPQPDQTLRLENLGTAPLGKVKLSLTGAHASAFALTTDELSQGTPGADPSPFTVAPVQGLDGGAYAATLRAVGEYGVVAELPLAFLVRKSLPVFADSEAYDIPASTAGEPIAPVDVSGGVSGGEPPYTFTAVGLPDGVGISAEGVISGAPAAAGPAGEAAVTATDSAGAEASISVAYGAVSAAPPDLVGIEPPDAIDGVANGAAKTAEALGLPERVAVATTEGPAEAAVEWDVASCAYDPGSAAAQTFTVKGTVALPDGVTNDGAVPLGVEIVVTVAAREAATVSGIAVKDPPAKTDYAAGESLDLSGLVVTLSYSDSTFEDVAFADFQAKGVSADPAHGEALTAGRTSVTITAGAHSATQAITVAPYNPPGVRYNVSVSALPEGGGSVVGGGTFESDSMQTVTAEASPGYEFVRWVEDGAALSDQPAYTFALARDRSLVAEFRRAYAPRILTHPSGVRVGGLLMADAVLKVEKLALHAEGTCAACDAIRDKQRSGAVIASFDLSLSSGSYEGDLRVGIPAGGLYEGRRVVVAHCAKGVLETSSAVVSGGMAEGAFSGLSPFAVVLAEGSDDDPVFPGQQDPEDDPAPQNPGGGKPSAGDPTEGPAAPVVPKVGDGAPALPGALAFTAVLACGLGLLARRRLGGVRRRR